MWGRWAARWTGAQGNGLEAIASGPDEGDSNAIETIYFAALTLAKERVVRSVVARRFMLFTWACKVP
mgnify:CR=1 FL=1